MAFKRQPLPVSFLIIGMVGFLLSVVYWNSGRLPAPWAFTFLLISLILLVSSLITLRESVELEKKTRTAPHHRPLKKKRRR